MISPSVERCVSEGQGLFCCRQMLRHQVPRGAVCAVRDTGNETRGGGFSRSINAASAPTTFRSLGAEGADDVTLDRPATLPTPVGPVPSGSGPKTLSVASAQAPTAVGDDTARSGLRAILDFTNRPRDEWHSANPQRLLRARCAALSTHALPTGRA